MESHNHHTLSRDLHLWIDTYDDLFSDFDPRPFTERIISDDFIAEMNKLTEEKEERIKSLIFQIPGKMRDESSEKIIHDRLSNDFKSQYIRFAEEWNTNFKRGFLIIFGGLASLSIAILISQSDLSEIIQDVLKVLLEPAGWFMMWTGLDKVAFGGRSAKRKRDFYHRLSRCKVEFVSI